jgi:hypothetical protein
MLTIAASLLQRGEPKERKVEFWSFVKKQKE